MRSIFSASSDSESFVRGFAPEARRSARAVLEPGRTVTAAAGAGLEATAGSEEFDVSPAVVDAASVVDGAVFLGECFRGRC